MRIDPEGRVVTRSHVSGPLRRQALLAIILVAAFGPYLSNGAGVRTDHLVIYASGLWALANVSMGSRPLRLSGTLWIVAACLGGATAWTLLVSLLVKSAPPLGIIAGTENYFQPLVLIVGLAVLVALGPFGERRHRMLQAIVITCGLLAANTVIAIASVFLDTWPLVQWFVRGATGTGQSVWQNAASLGRYSGVFNQPMEAGVAYSVGLVGWVYWSGRNGHPSFRHFVLLGALLVGGLLSVSKVFILGGVPLAGLYFIWSFKPTAAAIVRYGLIGTAFLAVFVPAAIWLMSQWVGQFFFLRLFDAELISSRGLIALYTAGRFGSEQTLVKDLFVRTWTESPLYGFGFGAFSPMDNAYIQFFFQGGLVASVLYALMIIALTAHALRHYRAAPAESRLLIVLIILVLGAGLGAPVLTLNRSSIMLWTLIALTVSTSSSALRSKEVVP